MTHVTRRQQAVEAIQRKRVSAIIRTTDEDLASHAMNAAVEGGIQLIEFTLTTPGALTLIESFAKRTDLTVGAGTVLTTQQAHDAVSAGAQFLVSPIADAEIVSEAAILDVACIPGAYTPTEMEAAHRLGADFVKVFPAPHGGAAFIEAVRGPLPHLKLFPTAGVTPNNFLDYLELGCAGVGFVGALFDRDDLERADFASIRTRAKLITRRLADSRFAP